MKQLFVILIMSLGTAITTHSQHIATEREIKRLEKAQCDAIVAHDTLTLYKIWAKDFIVNTPTHQISNLDEAKGFIRNRLIDYSLFETHPEEIQVYDNCVVTMGSELIKPVRKAPMAGQTVKRRYTHVWMKREGAWRLVARHAHIIEK